MKLNIKDYKIKRTKKYFKNNNLFFVVSGINRSTLDWLLVKQKLKTIELNCHQPLSSITIKTLNTSVLTKAGSVIKGSTFFIRPKQAKHFLGQKILTTFILLFFELLIIKFNNKIYSTNNLKKTYSISYKETKLLLYQFIVLSLKTSYKLSK